MEDSQCSFFSTPQPLNVSTPLTLYLFLPSAASLAALIGEDSGRSLAGDFARKARLEQNIRNRR